MYYTNKDLQNHFGFSEQTCRDLVGTKGIPLFPAAHGKKNKHSYAHNLYNPKSVAQIVFLLNKQDGQSYDEQAQNLIKSVRSGTPINLNQEEFDMFYDANSIAAVNRKLDDIMAIVQGRVSAPVQEPQELQQSNPIHNINVFATSGTAPYVQIAMSDIIRNLHTLNGQTFRKANLLDLLSPENFDLALRMRKDKDTVWNHTRTTLMREGYIQQGPTRDTLQVGPVAMNDIAPVQTEFNNSVEGHA